MSLSVTNVVEKCVVNVPILPVVVPTNTATQVLANVTQVQAQYSGRYIQNVGANDCYYAFDTDASATVFNGILFKPSSTNANGHGSGQQLDCSNNPCKVSIFSVGGTTIAVSLFARQNLQYGIPGTVHTSA